MGGSFIKKNVNNSIDELLNLKKELEKLNCELKEKEFIVDRTKEYLFILENQNELKNKQIDDLKVNNEIITKKDNQIKKLNEINEKKLKHAQENKFIFSIIIHLFNKEKYLQEAIDSILNQYFIFDNVEIILVDDGSSDSCSQICKNYVNKYPNNIKYIHQGNQRMSDPRNTGLKAASGKFINFLDSKDKLEPNTLNELFYYFNKFGDEIDIISMPIWQFDTSEESMMFFDKYDSSRIVDTNKEFDFPITTINSTFLRRIPALKFKFDKHIGLSEDTNFISRLILEKGKFGIVDSVKYMYRKRPRENSLIDTKTAKYFNKCIEHHFKGLIYYSIDKFGEVLKYIQSTLIYNLQFIFLNKTEVDVLNSDELNEFHRNIHDVLQYIDDDIILLQRFSKFVKCYMLNIKYNYPILNIKDNLILLNGISFDKLSDNKITLFKNNNSILKGYFKFYSNDIKINAIYENKNLDLEIISVEEEISLSHAIAYTFNFIIQSENIPDLNYLRFELEFNSNNHNIPIDILDCKYSDEATSSNHNDNIWTSWKNYPLTIIRQSEYTKITQSNVGTTGYLIFPFRSLNPSIIEYDFYKDGGSLNETIIQLRNDKYEILRGIPLININHALKLNTWYHIKLDFENKKIYVGDYDIPMNTTTSTNLFIACTGTTKSIKYKNFKVY